MISESRKNWALSKDGFVLPRSETGGQRPASVTLEGWLEDTAKEAIKNCACTTGDSSKMLLYIQIITNHCQHSFSCFLTAGMKAWNLTLEKMIG